MDKLIAKASAMAAHTDLRSMARSFVLLTLGAALMALNLNLFLAPFDIAPGGTSGLAIIINQFTGWQIGLVMLVLNLPLLWLGFRHLGRFRFLARTSYVLVLYSLGVDFLAQLSPMRGIAEDVFLNALFGGILGGVATGLILRGGGSAPGTGILGRVIQVKTGIPVSQVYLMTDGVVVLLAGLVFGWELALYALVAIFLWGLAADYVLEGPSVVRTAFIITDSGREVSAALFRRFGVGVTAWPSEGMFTGSAHTVLFCTISRPDATSLRTVVAEADPKAFVVVGHGHQASGGVLRQVVAHRDRERGPQAQPLSEPVGSTEESPPSTAE
ncbi:MAG: YitT family protein [Chloroflexi bacterium]|nr:YitT family protein [Chloroflexota bacterium]